MQNCRPSRAGIKSAFVRKTRPTQSNSDRSLAYRPHMNYAIFVALNVLACGISCQTAKMLFRDQPAWLWAMAIFAGVPIVALSALQIIGTFFELRASYILAFLVVIAGGLSLASRVKQDVQYPLPARKSIDNVEELSMQSIVVAL